MTFKTAARLGKSAGANDAYAPEVGTHAQADRNYRVWSKKHPNPLTPWRRRKKD